MKTKFYLLIALCVCFLFTACQTLSYLGDTYPINQKVKVYYDVHDVKEAYKVMGHITCAITSNEEAAKNEMLGKAKLVGADAIVFKGLSYTGGKDSSPVETADVLKFTDALPAPGN